MWFSFPQSPLAWTVLIGLVRKPPPMTSSVKFYITGGELGLPAEYSHCRRQFSSCYTWFWKSTARNGGAWPPVRAGGPEARRGGCGGGYSCCSWETSPACWRGWRPRADSSWSEQVVLMHALFGRRNWNWESRRCSSTTPVSLQRNRFITWCPIWTDTRRRDCESELEHF